MILLDSEKRNSGNREKIKSKSCWNWPTQFEIYIWKWR